MKLHTLFLSAATFAVLFISPLSAKASDFDWALDLNLRSDSNPSRYSSQLGSRFGIQQRRAYDIIRRVDRPADAYMILRLSEMTSRSPDYIIREYRSKKYQGWGDFAHHMGIKPGSADFKAFRNGHDIRDNYDKRDDRKHGHKKSKKKHHKGKNY